MSYKYEEHQYENDIIIQTLLKYFYSKSLTEFTQEELNKLSYEIIGLDQSKHMLKVAKDYYSNCNFVNGDILNNNLFEFNSFNIVTCLGKTLYEIKDKETFFENCYGLLEDNGVLIVNVLPEASQNTDVTPA